MMKELCTAIEGGSKRGRGRSSSEDSETSSKKRQTTILHFMNTFNKTKALELLYR